MNQAGILVQFAESCFLSLSQALITQEGLSQLNVDSDMDISGWVSLNFSNTFYSSQQEVLLLFHFILGFCLSFRLWINSHHLFRTSFPTLLLAFFSFKHQLSGFQCSLFLSIFPDSLKVFLALFSTLYKRIIRT